MEFSVNSLLLAEIQFTSQCERKYFVWKIFLRISEFLIIISTLSNRMTISHKAVILSNSAFEYLTKIMNLKFNLRRKPKLKRWKVWGNKMERNRCIYLTVNWRSTYCQCQLGRYEYFKCFDIKVSFFARAFVCTKCWMKV